MQEQFSLYYCILLPVIYLSQMISSEMFAPFAWVMESWIVTLVNSSSGQMMPTEICYALCLEKIRTAPRADSACLQEAEARIPKFILLKTPLLSSAAFLPDKRARLDDNRYLSCTSSKLSCWHPYLLRDRNCQTTHQGSGG